MSEKNIIQEQDFDFEDLDSYPQQKGKKTVGVKPHKGVEGGQSRGGGGGFHRGSPGGKEDKETDPRANAMKGTPGIVPGKTPGSPGGSRSPSDSKDGTPFAKPPKKPGGKGKKPAEKPGGKAKKPAIKPTTKKDAVPKPPVQPVGSKKDAKADVKKGKGDEKEQGQGKDKEETWNDYLDRALADIEKIKVFPGGSNKQYPRNKEFYSYTLKQWKKSNGEDANYPGDSPKTTKQIKDSIWIIASDSTKDDFEGAFIYFGPDVDKDFMSQKRFNLFDGLYKTNNKHNTEGGIQNLFVDIAQLKNQISAFTETGQSNNELKSYAFGLIDLLSEAEFYALKSLEKASKSDDAKNKKIVKLLKSSLDRLTAESKTEIMANNSEIDFNAINSLGKDKTMVAPRPQFPKPQQQETKTMNKSDIKQLIKEAFTDRVYGQYPYSHLPGDEEEPKEDYIEEWKKFCLGIVQDKTKERAIALAKVFIQDIELFEDVLDLAGQNQSIGSEILKKMQKIENNMV
jgi:hypothetical protein